MQRAAGILLHPTSLPGPYGIGDLGEEAYRFVDFLVESGQTLWQILPLGHISYGNSPYMCLSAFAGNPYLISLDKLVQMSLLEAHEISNVPEFSSDRVDYGTAIAFKMPLLEKSFSRFQLDSPRDYQEFCRQNAFWLEDYSLFTALKEAHDNVTWTEWESGARDRTSAALERRRKELSERTDFWKYLQYVFFRQWRELKSYCEKRKITVIGDIPIYVAHDSAEVWANRDLFFLDKSGNPTVIAGVPPDYFSATGQRWGNPIYRWDVMAERGYTWWINRFRSDFALVDTVRLDHFRGFEAYWEIPAHERTAETGKWVKGPGADLFRAVEAAIGAVQMIAEDLGVITPEVDALRDELGFPGMKILQMAFGNDPKASEYRPHHHTENSAVYTATHDHNTTVGWFTAEPGTQSTQTREEVEKERDYTLKYLGTDGSDIHWDFIRAALRSVSRLAIYPLQDVLGLGSDARMNMPGTLAHNWEWRYESGMLTRNHASRLKELTAVYERFPSTDSA